MKYNEKQNSETWKCKKCSSTSTTQPSTPFLQYKSTIKIHYEPNFQKFNFNGPYENSYSNHQNKLPINEVLSAKFWSARPILLNFDWKHCNNLSHGNDNLAEIHFYRLPLYHKIFIILNRFPKKKLICPEGVENNARRYYREPARK